MLKTKTTASALQWNLNLRINVGDTVRHLDRDWVNVTGINNEPGFNNSNWEVVSPINFEVKPIIIVNGNKFTLDKHPDNNDPLNAKVLEVNDAITSGWWDNSEYWILARFIGADKDVKADWQVLSNIEEIPII